MWNRSPYLLSVHNVQLQEPGFSVEINQGRIRINTRVTQKSLELSRVLESENYTGAACLKDLDNTKGHIQ